jgi:hypothetical protein
MTTEHKHKISQCDYLIKLFFPFKIISNGCSEKVKLKIKNYLKPKRKMNENKASRPQVKDIEESIVRMIKRASGEKDQTVRRDGEFEF